jgi:hypothetical protein
MDVTGKGETESVMHTFYRVPRRAGKAQGCRSGRKSLAFWRDLRTGAEFGSYITDVVDKCAGRRLPGLACGKLEAVLRRHFERRQDAMRKFCI